ncbi:CBS domain-containing protein [Aurantivibrio plasticivorans]
MSQPVSNLMSVHVHGVAPDEPLELIHEILTDVHYHHLLVEENERLIGIISDRDVLSSLCPHIGTDHESEADHSLLALSAQDIMTKDPITISPHQSLSDAAGILLKHEISILPVVDASNVVVGILSWKDILRAEIKPDDLPH